MTSSISARPSQHVAIGVVRTIGADALVSDEMKDTMALCVGCKGCKRECPTGVDMAKMKVEFLHHYNQRHGVSLRDKLVATFRDTPL